MAGFHSTSRSEVSIEAEESKVKLIIPDPEKLRTTGDLVSFDAVEYRFPKAKTPFLSGVTFTVEQGASRTAFVGAVGSLSHLLLPNLTPFPFICRTGRESLPWVYSLFTVVVEIPVELTFPFKTVKLILGTLLPTTGVITRHPLLTGRIGYFSQHSVEELSGSTLDQLSIGPPPTALSYFIKHFEAKGEKVLEQDVRQCLGSFGLQGRIASDTPLSQLSGGQKVRQFLVVDGLWSVTTQPPRA